MTKVQNCNTPQIHDVGSLEQKIIEEKRQTRKEKKASIIRYISLTILVIQFSSYVLVMKYANEIPNHKKYARSSVVLFTELIKFAITSVLYFMSCRSLKKFLRGIRYHFVYDFVDTLKVGVPAIIYTAQNYLLYLAIEHIDSTTYLVTYQTKTLTTALFSVLMLRKRLSVSQWISLFILSAGVAVVTIAKEKATPAKIDLQLSNLTGFYNTSFNFTGQNTNDLLLDHSNIDHVKHVAIGIGAVLVACVFSGFAGVYFEKVLKKSNVSLWMRNLQLSTLAIPAAVATIFISDYDLVRTEGLAAGFNIYIWSAVLLQAIGGLVIAVVIKYADNIIKSLASSLAIIVSAIAVALLFNRYPTILFGFGTVMVIFSVVMYSYCPVRKNEDAGSENEQPAITRELSDSDLVKGGDKKIANDIAVFKV
ncbi:unnamed protein product [Bursaphelenchus xylophilus]|uniref:(pine wood nematode) hypothetical protein n=1 Tax=Bursaphelenchus xylophilus TaxID=6326 RepID=A0A1I7S9Q4_BURXY|nr:unnamed protein product [Bursaphelenchus xylophilus]CAG9129166.1 unnamed protein product [Bursaphelenchus xylophilus]